MIVAILVWATLTEGCNQPVAASGRRRVGLVGLGEPMLTYLALDSGRFAHGFLRLWAAHPPTRSPTRVVDTTLKRLENVPRRCNTSGTRRPFPIKALGQKTCQRVGLCSSFVAFPASNPGARQLNCSWHIDVEDLPRRLDAVAGDRGYLALGGAGLCHRQDCRAAKIARL